MIEIIPLDGVALTCLRPVGAPAEQQYIEALDNLGRWFANELESQRKCVFVVDMRDAAPPQATQRRIASDWMKKNVDRFMGVSLGAAFVISSPLVRGALTAVFWLQPLKVPHDMFGHLDDAVRWAIGRLDAENLPVPERVRAEPHKAFDFE